MAMNDKQRLKDSDAIMNSLSKRLAKRTSAVLPGIPAAQPGQAAAQEEPERQAPGYGYDGEQKAPPPRGGPPRTQEELEERLERIDANPLDFGKYDLKTARRDIPAVEPETMASVNAAAAAMEGPEAGELPGLSEEDEEMPEVREFTYESFGGEDQEEEPEDEGTPISYPSNTSFQDTLAEKFMREREKYLQELGIAGDLQSESPEEAGGEEPAAKSPVSARKVLDFNIQPEMHRAAEELPDRPVTYSPTGSVQIQQDSGEELPYEPQADAPEEPETTRGKQEAKDSGQGDKKTGEDLLMELAALNSLKQAPAPHKRAMNRPKRNLGFEPGQIRSDLQKGKGSSKVIIISAAASLVVLVLAVSLLLVVGRSGRGSAGADGSPAYEQTAADESGTLTVYETRRFEERATYNDVLVKKGGIMLQNLTVDNYLVIEDIQSQGAVTLSDVEVGGAIYLRGCAVDYLELNNVQAERIVINNDITPVTVRASGATDVSVLEIKTTANIEQAELPQDQPGIRSALLKAAQEESTLSVAFTGLRLQTLAAEGENTLEFSDTNVEAMTTEGSLALDGTGRIISLAAGTDDSGKPLELNLKGVSIASLNLKSPAGVNVAAEIDTAASADNVSLVGTGTIGSLTMNSRFGNSRLLVDLSGLNIQTLIAESELRIDSAGSSLINTLVANESVYALGNKVNHLKVNADGVIYEKEPDRITVGEGVRPPETMADNPHLDYSLTSSENEGRPAGDEAATCGHPQESGGFLYGDGSKSNPFEISTPAQLAHVALHPSSHYIQTGDIDMADDSQFSGGFTPIGSDGTPFSGTYDGGGYAIKNLRITASEGNIGLFGDNTGTIRNVNVVSGDISTTAAGSSVYMGGIAGLNYQGGIVANCSNGAKITGTSGSYAGGVVGYNYGGRITNSYNAAKVSGGGYVGGVAGVNRETATIASCYNVGTLESNSATAIGAVAGMNESATVTNCYYLEDTAEEGIGTGTGTASEVTSEQMQSEQLVADLSVGAEDSPWTRGSDGYSYPVLRKPVQLARDDEEE